MAAAEDGRVPVVEARGLSKRFGGLHALRDVSVEIRNGEILGMIGANGAGKSTLIKTLTGAVTADSGEILVLGKRVHIRQPDDALSLGIVAVQQELVLAWDHSVMENVFLGRLPGPAGVVFSRRRARRESRRIQQRVGLDVEPDRMVATLTPAQQRLVMVAAALAREPHVLILDEPTAALPPEESAVVARIVRQLAEQGESVVYVTHRLHEIEQLAARVVAMRDGRVAGVLERDAIEQDRMVELVAGSSAREEPEPLEHAEISESIVLQTRGLYGRRVKNVNLDVYAGEIVGIAGLAGSGRSELLRLLYGAQAPTAGKVLLRGKPLTGPPRARARMRVGYIAEGRRTNILPAMSVRANISVAALLENSVGRVFINPAWERRGAAKIASDVALVGGPAAGIETLSGGNQQKALLARWLLRGVDLLLLDEPTAGIDVHARAEIHQLLRRLAHSGATIVMASVEPEELALECDRVLVLVEGEITQELRAPFDVDRVVAASYGRRRPAA